MEDAMKTLHVYEVQLLDGSCYRGEIVYKDDKKLVLRQQSPEQKLHLFYNGIISIKELGWLGIISS
jgi:hypothetical protein